EESTNSKNGNEEKAKGTQKKKNKANEKQKVVANEEENSGSENENNEKDKGATRRRRTRVTGIRKRWRKRKTRRVLILKMGKILWVDILVATLLVLAMAVLFMAKPGQAIACQQVDLAISPYVSYLTGNIDEPSPAYCNGVSSIKQNIPTKTNWQTACQCVKDAATKISTLKDDAAQQLPAKCKI
ncbi:Lipid transfer protein/Par allergen, partial [Parasponia andersonii]